MIFKQIYLESLGHASYFVGSEETGEALVLDTRRDVDVYFREARAQGMRIRYAADTHQHNDYVTGICELPARGEVKLLAAARAEVRYPVRRMRDGERLEMGEVVFELLETPGHTPEHASFLVTDRSRGEEPAVLLSGGALLVDDVARPDLLGGKEATERGAADLCRTLQKKILRLPDHLEVYPTHVSGSLCGGNIGSRLSTTIGYERRMNELLAGISSKKQFIRHCLDLEGLPAVPPYWKRMRRLNQEGPPLLGVLGEPPALRVEDFDRLRKKDGAVVLDCRSPEAFAAHVPGALNVKRERERTKDLVLLDVRQPKEWTAGRVPGAIHVTGATLPERLDEIPKHRPIATLCGSGYRSSVAASLLQRAGREPVFNVLGGMAAWKSAGFETTDRGA